MIVTYFYELIKKLLGAGHTLKFFLSGVRKISLKLIIMIRF